MDSKVRYQRTILFFDNEDSGYGLKQEPSGYTKIEVKDGRGTLSVNVQNLKEENGAEYRAYIIKADQSGILPVCAGNVPLVKNKGELHWDFEPGNVGGSGSHIDGFNVVAVICDRKNIIRKKLICPLTAYRNNKAEWRARMEQFLYPASASMPVSSNQEEAGDITSKYGWNLESKYSPKPQTVSSNAAAEAQSVSPIVQDDNTSLDNQEVQPGQETNQNGNKDNPEEYSNKAEAAADINEEADDNNKTYEKPAEAIKENSQEGVELPGSCMMQNAADEMGNMCDPLTFGTGTNPCEGCSAMCQKVSGTGENIKNPVGTPGMGELKKTLAKYFEISDPFRSKRKDYQWWKAASAVQLNNILYQFNLRTPLLYNPKVLTAHFKYRHLIVGIYSDRITRLEYIVCGIPSVYGIDAKPFGEYCRWAQVEGNIPKYGAFGYWLAYINPRSGEMLRLGS